MSVFQPGNVAYGLSQPLIGVPNEPIVSQRAPTTADRAAIGTLWIDQPTNTPYILTSIVDNIATWVFASGGSSVLSIVTSAGTAIPVAGVINLFEGANILTSAAGNTITVAVTPNINLPATNAAGTQGIYEIGGSHFAFAYPPSNTFVGISAGNTTLNFAAASGNTGVGSTALENLTLGYNNTALGENSSLHMTTGNSNVTLGQASGFSLTTGSLNTSAGFSALGSLLTGSYNIAIGQLAGTNYTGAESDNILIGNEGVVGESNVIRIGTQGSGAAQQDATAIAGIYNTAIGATNQVMFIDNTGFIGSSKGTDGQVIIGSTAGSPAWANLTAGANVTITNAANSITIASSGGGGGITALEADDTNTATGATVTIAGGSNINTTAGGSTLTVNLDNNVTISGNYTTTAGVFDFPATSSSSDGVINQAGSNFLHSFGDPSNVFLGLQSQGSFTASGGLANVGLGFQTLFNLTSGGENLAMGYQTLYNALSGSGNVVMGNDSCAGLTTGNNNTAVGRECLINDSGSYNTYLGWQCGSAAVAGTESSNIYIQNAGVVSENNTIRIGTQGSGNAQQDACWIAGIYGVTPGGGGIQTVVMDNTGQLGTSAGGGSGIVTIDGDTGSATGATVTFNAHTNSGSTVQFVASGATVDLEVTDSGTGDTFIGLSSGNPAYSGVGGNTALGNNTLSAITTGINNCAFGYNTMHDCTTSSANTAIGEQSLFSLATGTGGNTALGETSLEFLTTGEYNIVLGVGVANNYTSSESHNIIIGNSGVAAESNVIRIGTQGSGIQEQNQCFIAGITGVTVASSAAVLIDTATGQLGTISSSRRYKENINDMDNASNNIMNLRPTTFFMKNDPTKQRQYGLIAEEVNEILPDLVTYNKAGDPESVKYHDLPVLLLNELQKQNNIIAELQRKIAVLENRRRYESEA